MSESADLLVEIGCEELPPLALSALSQAFSAGVLRGLQQLGYRCDELQSFATPRRLAVYIKDVPAAQAPQIIKRRGPAWSAAFDADGQPNKAGLGFATACGVSVEQIQRIQTEKGDFLYYEGEQPGHKTSDCLPTIIEQALAALPIPKRMRWGEGKVEFIRPLHWVTVLWGEMPVPGSVLGVACGAYTHGHRVYATEPLFIDKPAHYRDILYRQGRVIADFTERRAAIEQQVQALAAQLGGHADLAHNDALLNEVTALVEWPCALSGGFSSAFLAVPQEALVMSMQANQKYFPVYDDEGKLTQHFIAVANIESAQPEQVQRGNERVIRPRLADAQFFWEQDKQRSLPRFNEYLSAVLFHKKLGSLYDKAERIGKLAALIAAKIGASPQAAERAGLLCKADLMTQMVSEFPKLQGIMGRYYALESGEPVEIADAIEAHYLPRYAGDHLPQNACGQSVALADKLDTLIGIFAIGEKPSGDKDPFALRRAAIGVLRILIDCQLDLDLLQLLKQAAAQYPANVKADAVVDEVFGYILNRLQGEYESDGYTPQTIHAVLSLQPPKPLDFHRRLQAVQAFVALPEADSLAAANKRIRNILKKAGDKIPQRINSENLQENAEQVLYQSLNTLSAQVTQACKKHDYTQALKLLATLKAPVDAFFDNVMVMAEDEKLRANRLALLAQLQSLFLRIADIAQLQS